MKKKFFAYLFYFLIVTLIFALYGNTLRIINGDVKTKQDIITVITVFIFSIAFIYFLLKYAKKWSKKPQE